MRLFVALDIKEEIRARIADFMSQMRGLPPKLRWVNAESLHVTLKFIGERPDAELTNIESALQGISAEGFRASFRDAGFFPNAKSARVFWVGIEAEPGMVKLAGEVDKALAAVGVPEEKRAFSPHLTLARASGGSGAPGRQKSDHSNRMFAEVQKRLSEIPSPEFGTILAREFFLYRSQLSSQGSRYTKIARFALAAPQT